MPRNRKTVTGKIYGDKRSRPYLDGDMVTISLLYSAQYEDHWIVTAGIPGGERNNRNTYLLEKIYEHKTVE